MRPLCTRPKSADVVAVSTPTGPTVLRRIPAIVGYSIGSGGNGFFANPCTNQFEPFSPVEAPMGANNTFSNVCYMNTDIASLGPPQPCK